MTKQKIIPVKFSANFDTNLASIEAFWTENSYPKGFDQLLDELSEKVIPNLERFPAIGRPFFARRAESIEALSSLEKLEKRVAKLDKKGELREYVMEEDLVLYAVMNSAVYLLSIKHHKQLSFDLKTSIKG